MYVGLTVAAIIFVSPIIVMVVGSIKPDERVLMEAGTVKAFVPTEVTFENYGDVFERVRTEERAGQEPSGFGTYMRNSLVITGSIVLGGLIINSLAGYAFARLRWRGRNALFAVVLGLMILPFESIAVPLFYEVTMFGWRNTLTAQIIPFIANPFAIYLFYSFFIGMPKELEETARIDGASVWRTFLQIIVPNSKPVFATVAIVTFLFYWGLYIWPLMVTSGPEVRPLPVGIAEFYTLPPLQWGDIMAFGVMMVAPVIVVFVAFQRWFVEGVATSGLKG